MKGLPVPKPADTDEYNWYRCRHCKARVLDGWTYLHDSDCPRYRDDENEHEPPREY